MITFLVDASLSMFEPIPLYVEDRTGAEFGGEEEDDEEEGKLRDGAGAGPLIETRFSKILKIIEYFIRRRYVFLFLCPSLIPCSVDRDIPLQKNVWDFFLCCRSGLGTKKNQLKTRYNISSYRIHVAYEDEFAIVFWGLNPGGKEGGMGMGNTYTKIFRVRQKKKKRVCICLSLPHIPSIRRDI